MKLLSLTVLAATAALSFSTAAHADEAPACTDGYVAVASAGGPLCVSPTYLDGTWQDDPATCTNGYYQGSCVPAEYAALPPVVFTDEAYAYQTIPTPTEAAAPAVVAVTVAQPAWLNVVELALGDQSTAR